MAKKLTAPIIPLMIIFCSFCQNVQAQMKLDVGGYLQNWVIANERNELLETSIDDLSILNTRTVDTQGLRIRRARLVARGRINDSFSAETWIEFAGNTPSLLCFYGDAHITTWFNIRMGQFIMPGQSFDTSRQGSASLNFYERPSTTTRLSNVMGYTAFRDVGIMAYGQYGRLWYGVHAGNGGGRFNHAGTSITERKFGSGLYGARVDLEVIDGLIFGGHVSTNQQRDVVQNGFGPYDIDRTSGSFRIATRDLGIHGLTSQFEYMFLTANDDQIGYQAINNGEYKLHGFYAELGYKFNRDWQILGRYDELTEKPVLIAENLIATRSLMNSYTLGVSRFIFDDNREIAKLQLNYSFGETGPEHLNHSILVLVLQLRFLP